MYYGLITLSALMFSTQFFFTGMFRKSYGGDMQAMLVSSAGGAVVGIIILFLLNGLRLNVTLFTLLIAFLAAINSMGIAYCSLKVLGKANLSIYSLFMMLGGMALPFIAGIFFGENLTIGKVICFVFITVALVLTVDSSKQRSGKRYYYGIFILNGLAGVISMLYKELPYEKVSASEYSILCAIVSFVLSVVLLIFIKKEKRPLDIKAIAGMFGSGGLNRIGNLLLLISLTHLDASVQYPFITGGTIIFSTIISSFTSQKPSKREIYSVAVAFTGLIIMFFLEK